ncbi:PQQ-dependent sugar dehydrogenase [Aeromicrobium panaciterrae]|uniref:PQQ-dependent sugar dehydrogenase n=1 Tax=Aeromicrobium panaciterrae TaxID=363861 RepID=UPI0031D7BEA1
MIDRMIGRRTFLTGIAGAGALALAGCGSDDKPAPPKAPTATTSTTPTTINPKVASTVATGLNVPWGIAFLASGAAYVSQRDDGSLLRIDPDGTVTPLGGVDGADAATSEGGLMGIALDPDDESVLYAYMSTRSDDRLVRLAVTGDAVGKPEPLITGVRSAANHHGGRLVFDDSGHLFLAIGDGAVPDDAQDKGSLNGTILRLDKEGKPASGNPFGNEVWSYGHRNVEGLAFDADGRLWASEFGQDAFDELNLIQKGGNYGWPQVEGTSDDPDFVTPKVTWHTDECSPAGIAITRSTAFMAGLRGECVWMIPLDGESAGKPVRLFEGEYGRIRDVVVAPDESLWVSTSNTDSRGRPDDKDDRILRVTL